MARRRRVIVTCVVAVAATGPWAGRAAAETGQDMVIKPWTEGAWGETFDRPLYEAQGHVKGEDKDAEVFWWDSTGRFRFDKDDPHSLTLGYRWATMDFSTHSTTIPNHLDDISLAAAVPITSSDSGSFSVVLGAGYSSDTPFSDADDLYGIGHLIYERPLSKDESLFFTLDYNGNQAYLPDVPLPGVTYVKRGQDLTFGAGFPQSWVSWKFMPRWTATASYEVPYTADVRLEYELIPHVSLFGDYANFFHPFGLANQPPTERVFFEMSRAEVGVRYSGTVAGFSVDAALVVGYAFEQHFYEGFDVRRLDSTGSISDEPYIGIQLMSQF